jgi:hypothetical protein
MTPTLGTQIAIQLMGFHTNMINPLTPLDVIDAATLANTLANVSGNLYVIGTLPEPIATLDNSALIRIHTLPDARIVAHWAAQQFRQEAPSHGWVSAYYAYEAVAAPSR